MCRLFAAISNEPLDPAFLLLKAPQSLLAQSSADPKRQQKDGWGMGWYEGHRVRVFKRPRFIRNDVRRAEQGARQAQGPIFLAHIRAASNPMKLPRRRLIGRRHTQPFSHGRWLFVHNGTLLIPKEVKNELGRWSRFVKGNNDSEVLFYWLLKTFLPKAAKSPGAALRSSLNGLREIWASLPSDARPDGGPFHGLNFALTNGRVFYGFCCGTTAGLGKARAILSKRQPYFQLQFRRTSDSLLIASEPLDLGNKWKPARNGELLLARRSRRRVTFRSIRVL